MEPKSIALFWQWCVLLAGENGLPRSGRRDWRKLVMFTKGNWEVMIECYLLSQLLQYVVSLSSQVMVLTQLRNRDIAFFYICVAGRNQKEANIFVRNFHYCLNICDFKRVIVVSRFLLRLC